ncbi:MAG: Lnb N-terminal periplasmic domain-containing protein [Bacteriovorax sp.]
MPLLLLLALLFNLLTPAESSAGALYDGLQPIQQSYWLKLLHYYKEKSRADGEHFFLSAKGKTDPGAELEADVFAFKDHYAKAGWFNYHPQCVFRERYNFLKQAGLLEGVQDEPCEEFKEWKRGLNAQSITLVFSSSYPNNPSSLFGHTLIRLNQKNKTDSSPGDLLDYAVAYSAMPEKEDLGVVFAFKGLFGGYKGLLEVTKYYTKVTEYNNGESRDLIEYDLNMTPDELDRLINHLWEIYQTTYFDYYFADENCSAVLVDILAVPFHFDDVNVHERWYYLPSEMIKAFKKIPGRIKSEHFRASLKKQLEKRIEKLSPDDISEMKRLADSKNLPLDYANVPVLDGVISLLDFTRYRTKDKLTSDQKIMMRRSLLRRASLPQGEEEKAEVFDQNNRPDFGHEPQKLSFFLRSEESHSLVGVEFKQGYHDLMSNDLGFDPFSQFDFLTGTLVYDKSLNRVSYDQLTLVNLISLHTYTFYDPQFSWAAKITSDRIYDLHCDLCHKIDARAYLGPTFKPRPSMALSFMAGVFGEASKHLEEGYRAGLGFEGSFLYQLSSMIKIGFFDELRFDATKKIKKDYYNQIGFKESYFSGKNNEWRFESSMVSKFRRLSKETWINQLNYGFYF